MNDYEVVIEVNGMARWAIRFKPGVPIQLPADLCVEFGKRPSHAQLWIDPRGVPDDEIAARVHEARDHLHMARNALDRLP